MTPLSDLQYQILKTIKKLQPSASGLPIMDRYREDFKKNLNIFKLYKVIGCLLSWQYIQKRDGEATPERGGRKKSYYKITREGKLACNHFENSIVLKNS